MLRSMSPVSRVVYMLLAMTLLSMAPVQSAENPTILLEPRSLPARHDGDQREAESFMLDQRVLRNVTRSTLTPFLADPGNNTGIGVIVAPGGGFKILSIDREGTEVARWLNRQGINAFVLKYRLDPTAASDWLFKVQTVAAVGWSVLRNMIGSGQAAFPEGPMAQVQELAIDDALAAIRLVNERARAWGVRRDAIGILGFSAGGAVATGAAMLGRNGSRPDFVASIYGVPHVADIPEDGPPLFLLFAEDDPLVPPEWSDTLHRRWKQKGLDSTLVSYPDGGHGFGMEKRDKPTDGWIEVFHRWLNERDAGISDRRTGSGPGPDPRNQALASVHRPMPIKPMPAM